MSNVQIKRNCFMMDLDGTICDVRHRLQYVANNPKNWDAWNAGLVNDTPNLAVLKVFQSLQNNTDIDLIIVSGRSEDYRIQTENWLSKYELAWDGLFMRNSDDCRDDAIVKGELADEIEKTHHIIGVFDDRQKVVQEWLRRGYFVFDVGQGKGNF
jgi:trehalose-6-phosphatase